MELSPNEMRNHQFSTAIRGFNKAEVDAFRESAATILETARAEILKVTEEKERIEVKYNELNELQDTIKRAVLEAQKNSDQILANARKEAELLISEAKHRRDRAISEKYDEINRLEAKIKEIKFARDSFYTKLHSEIEAHLKMVNSIHPDKKQPEITPEQSVETHTEQYSEQSPPPVEDSIDESEMTDTDKQEQLPKDSSENEPESSAGETPSKPERPTLDMKDDDIDRVIDQFGEVETQEEEEVESGQSQGKDF